MPQTDKRAWLLLAEELEQHFLMPPGFREAWSIEHRDRGVKDLLLEGPFPDGIVEGGVVCALLETRDYNQVWWRWCDENAKPLGDWVRIE